MLRKQSYFAIIVLMNRELSPFVKEMLLDGKEPAEIKELNSDVKSSLITYQRAKLKLPKFSAGRKKGKFSTLENRRLARVLKCAGKTYLEIGRVLGVTRQRAAQYISDAPEVKAKFCSMCGRRPKILHYHHVSYKDRIVIAVCASCHQKIHLKEVDYPRGI